MRPSPWAQIALLDEVEQFRDAVGWLEQHVELIKAWRIGAWGASFSGGIVLYAAAANRCIRCVVAQSSVFGTSWMRYSRNHIERHQIQEMLVEGRWRLVLVREPRRMPVTCLPGESHPAMPGDDRAVGFIEAAEEQFPGYRFYLTLQFVEEVAEFFPRQDHGPHRVPCDMCRDLSQVRLHHPLERVEELFAGAGAPKKWVLLPYNTVGLYQGTCSWESDGGRRGVV